MIGSWLCEVPLSDWPFPKATNGLPAEQLEDVREALLIDVADARATGNRDAEAWALVGLAHVTYRLRRYDELMTHTEEAWRIAQEAELWPVLEALARFFGDVSLRALEFTSTADHYANACAYALMNAPEALWDAVSHIDRVADELFVRKLVDQATELYEMLRLYEESGGLGRPVPSFARHVGRRLNQLQQWGNWGEASA